MTFQTPSDPQAATRAGQLITFEGGLRQCQTADALGHFLVNEIPALTGAAQVFLFQHRRGRLRMTHATGISRPEPRAPLVMALEHHVATPDFAVTGRTDLAGVGTAEAPMAYCNGLALPLHHVQGGEAGLLLLAAAQPFTEAGLVLGGRVGQAAGHALSVFRRRSGLFSRRKPVWAAAFGGLSIAVLFIPVRFSALAPAEIIAANPVVITSPLDGVIAELLIGPNEKVPAGALLARFEDTDIKGRLAIAERAAGVAGARARRARQGAGVSAEFRGELAIAEAELAIAEAERDQAQALVARTLIHAPSAGLAIYSRREDWTGRPVSTGERIMQIAAPDDVAFRIELGLTDALALEGSGQARIFLDAEVLRPVAAEIIEAGHLAEPVTGDRIAFPVKARPLSAKGRNLRIGLRGTAQIYGPEVRLGYYLFRRPLSLFRQKFGL